jgi:HAD superfamily phosphoserine phosphatase-like hydrolase
MAARLVLFDIDGTLTLIPSSERRFGRMLWRCGLLGPRQIVAYVGFLLGHVWAYRRAVLKKNKAYLSGLEVTEVGRLARRFVAEDLLGQLSRVAAARLAEHLAQGDEVVLLSGTPDFIARPLAEHLGVRHVCATIAAERGGRFVAGAPVRHPFARAKLDAARAVAAETDLPLAGAAAYGNSADDELLLAAVAQPVAVNPDRKLRRTAEDRGWEIIADAAHEPGGIGPRIGEPQGP